MSATDLFHGILVVFGVGLVIFVHELGHYLAARWAGARVEVFSIGMGPKILGWTRRGTVFQVAVLPIGGYVKIAGEYPDGTRGAAPGELGSLSVFHRFVYYSGGVVMNVLFALVVMPLVLLVGLPGLEPVLGEAQKGTAAWHARLPAGARVESVNGHDPFDFMGLAMEVALSGKEPVKLDLLLPSGERREVAVPAEFDEETGTRKLGVASAADPEGRLEIDADGPAAAAGVPQGARLTAVVGQPQALPLIDQLERAMGAGEPVTLRVLGPDGAPREVVVAPEVEHGKRRLFGVMPVQNLVEDVRLGPNGAPGLAQALDLRPGDRLLRVAGQRVLRAADLLDALLTAQGPLAIVVRRGGAEVTLTAEARSLEERIGLAEDIHITNDIESSAVVVQPGRAAAQAGVQDGDRIVSIDGQVTDSWQSVFDAVQVAARANRPAQLQVWREVAGEGGAPATSTIALAISPAQEFGYDYGLGLRAYMGVQRADGVPEALRVGALASWRLLANTWRTLEKMLFTDEVSTKNLGGIITISVLSFHSASQGMAQLFFLLAFISLNLAILNLLPIPILDGGHLMFLLVEAVKGTPVSERTLGYSQVVGLVLLLSLMIYVTYQDVVRWFLQT